MRVQAGGRCDQRTVAEACSDSGMEMIPEVQGQGTHLWGLECKQNVQMLGLKDRNSLLIHSLTHHLCSLYNIPGSR